MGKPSAIDSSKGPKRRLDGVLKAKDLDKARRRVAKLEKKLRKLAAMTEEEQDEMCERQVRRKMEKAAKRASKDGSENPYADIADKRTSSKTRKKRLAQLKAGIREKIVAKRTKREEKLARLKEDIAVADNAMQVDIKSPTESSPTQASVTRKAGWNNWEAAEFESEERKAKFLRFMGVKGGGAGSTGSGSGTSPFASAITKEGNSKIQKDLEKQFQAGVQMRLQAQRGGRGGLGV
ncbi:hypothetical protein IWW37_003800 [Coemansia sp. RSA 2050]|nr:hypothetical protein IWW37_003800 [Coemansia sp. RSA 2050]KAJ2733991.1 hypothetical protein IW152_002647 [Coemansia sp. BCRC 34962]